MLPSDAAAKVNTIKKRGKSKFFNNFRQTEDQLHECKKRLSLVQEGIEKSKSIR